MHRHAWSTLLGIALAVTPVLADEAYRAGILKWRAEREQRLKADDGESVSKGQVAADE